MRRTALLGTGLALAIAAPAAAARTVRCCVPVTIAPGEPPRCVAAVLHVHGRVGARRLCRLIGGRPVPRGGGCACAPTVAGAPRGQ